MSILIRGAKMPENCFRCTFRTFGRCALSVEITDAICNDTRPDDCPLVPIPPHGRLIDADAMDTSILQAGFAYAITRRKLTYTPGEVREKIANAPTIIEAEE